MKLEAIFEMKFGTTTSRLISSVRLFIIICQFMRKPLDVMRKMQK